MKVVPKSVTVIVDSREQVPLLFPSNLLWFPDRSPDGKMIRVKKKVQKLDAGDYCLKEYPDVVGIERKGSNSELHGNLLTKDYARFSNAIARFRAAYKYKYLLLDDSIGNLWMANEYCPNPPRVWDCLMRELGDIQLLWGCNAKYAGPRRILGEQIVRLMLAHALGGDQ